MTFKVGDRVRILHNAIGSLEDYRGKLATVTFVGKTYKVRPDFCTKSYTGWQAELELVTEEQKTTPHPHAELIKAWADGATIQAKTITGYWVNVGQPGWAPSREYRIKPEKKPDEVRYMRLTKEQRGVHTSIRYDSDNLKLTFDGETGDLKSAEVIK